MPGLIGYMLAIVITLGGYLAGLHWLVSPPDPWQPNPKAARIAQQTAKKRVPVVTPAEAGVPPEATAPTEPDTKLASVETSEASASVQTSESETVTKPISMEAIRPAAEPAHMVHRDLPPARIRPGVRKRVERNTSRKLELMVLRTYERSDGKRFTRLLPISSARNALAFQPDDAW
jgi:hypothetical protein